MTMSSEADDGQLATLIDSTSVAQDQELASSIAPLRTPGSPRPPRELKEPGEVTL
nr:hypothetical protein [Rhodococcus wratislaviensis]